MVVARALHEQGIRCGLLQRLTSYPKAKKTVLDSHLVALRVPVQLPEITSGGLMGTRACNSPRCRSGTNPRTGWRKEPCLCTRDKEED